MNPYNSDNHSSYISNQPFSLPPLSSIHSNKHAHIISDTLILSETDPTDTCLHSSHHKDVEEPYKAKNVKDKGEKTTDKLTPIPENTASSSSLNTDTVKTTPAQPSLPKLIPAMHSHWDVVSKTKLTITITETPKYVLVRMARKNLMASIARNKEIEKENENYDTRPLKILDHLMLLQLHLKVYKGIQRDFKHDVGKPNVHGTKRLLPGRQSHRQK